MCTQLVAAPPACARDRGVTRKHVPVEITADAFGASSSGANVVDHARAGHDERISPHLERRPGRRPASPSSPTASATPAPIATSHRRPIERRPVTRPTGVAVAILANRVDHARSDHDEPIGAPSSADHDEPIGAYL